MQADDARPAAPSPPLAVAQAAAVAEAPPAVARAGAVRHRPVPALRDSAEQRRLARRGGVKRIGQITPTIRAAMRAFLTPLVHDAALYADHAGRRTVQLRDVQAALRRNDIRLYR